MANGSKVSPVRIPVYLFIFLIDIHKKEALTWNALNAGSRKPPLDIGRAISIIQARRNDQHYF